MSIWQVTTIFFALCSLYLGLAAHSFDSQLSKLEKQLEDKKDTREAQKL